MNDSSPMRAHREGGPRVAAVIITKNEERNIGACLESVEWADEKIVVDACSTDRTVDIARRYTPQVFVREWPGYGPQKNFGIEQAQAEWILVVDADERVTDSLRTEIQGVLRKDLDSRLGGFEIPRRNIFYGGWVRSGGNYPDYQLRLFRRVAGRYDGVLIHEHLCLDGQVARLTNPLDHFTMPTITHHVKKIAWYASLGAQEKLKQRSRIRYRDIAANHVVTILKNYFLRKGYQDGIRGLIVAMFSGMYTFVKYAKAWELRAQKG